MLVTLTHFRHEDQKVNSSNLGMLCEAWMINFPRLCSLKRSLDVTVVMCHRNFKPDDEQAEGFARTMN
jgi:hypothetical protein